MARLTLTWPFSIADELRAVAALPVETAGVLLCSVQVGSEETRLLAREFHPAPDDAYRERTNRRLRLGNAAYLAALSRAETIGAVPVFIHTHPDDEAVMSPLDDGVDEDLRSVFQLRSGAELYASVVVHLEAGTLRMSGRAWRGDERLGPIELFREVGPRLRFSGPAATSVGVVPDVFERQVAAFGPAMQALLGGLHIGVVGTGGTGSAVIEQLVRLGVGHLTLVDFDALAPSNVTRVYGSTIGDVPRQKVDVLAEHARSIGFGTVIDVVDGTITRRAIAERLAACDVVFGCTDDQSGRVVLSRLAYWLLIPVFDMGARIYAGDDHVTLADVVSRVNVVVPGAACLDCWGLIDPARLAAEQLAPAERAARRTESYAPDLDTPDPAVITYTTLAASLAVNEFLRRLTGVALEVPDRVLYQARLGDLSEASLIPRPGHWCADRAVWGQGPEAPFLGLGWTA